MSAIASDMLFVTQYYAPEQIGSGPFCTELAEWWALSSGPVTVLTSRPHYPEFTILPSYDPRRQRDEVLEDVVVTRVANWIPRRPTALRRIVSEIHFLLLGLLALASGRVRRSRLVFSLCPSILSVLLGEIATRRGGKHVAIVHDIQSGLAQGLAMVNNRRFVAALKWCESAILNRADLIVVPTTEMAHQLRGIGVMTSIEVVPIWVDAERISPLARAVGTSPKVLYSGNLGRKQGLGQVIELASELQARRPDIRVTLRGNGNEAAALAAEVSARQLRNVEIAGLVPCDRLNDELASGDIHLVPQDPQAADFAVPSKVFNIMAAGRAFVATARPGSSLWRLKEESRGFICVPPNDGRALTRAVLRLADNHVLRSELGRRGRQFVERHCTKSSVLGRLRKMVDELEGQGAPDAVIFEPMAEGHVLEWLVHVVHAAASSEARQVWFIVAGQIHGALLAQVPPNARGRIRIVELRPQEERLCLDRRLTIRAFAQWWILRRYLRRMRARSAFALSLDHLSLPLAMGFRFGEVAIGGVLFRPSVHYRTIGPYRPSVSERIRDLRKTVLYRGMLANGAVGRVLSLDTYFSEFAVAHYWRGRKVRGLVDPVFPPIDIADPDRQLARQMPSGRVRFVLFGSLQRRKGVLELLAALTLLDPETGSRASIMIAGRADDDLRDELMRVARDISADRPDIWLHVEDRRLASGEIAALVEGCDAVLAPYQRFVGSSGVLLWAAQWGKPVVTQDFGLVGRLVRDHRLGLAVDTTNSAALAGALAAIIRNGPAACFDQGFAARFAAGRTPQAFAAAVLASGEPPDSHSSSIVADHVVKPLLDHNDAPRLVTGRDARRQGQWGQL